MKISMNWAKSIYVRVTLVCLTVFLTGRVWLHLPPTFAGKEYNSGIIWPEPKVVTPGIDARPPSDAIVLFDGKSMDAWKGADKWQIADGAATAASVAETKEAFGDCQLHLEFTSPKEAKGRGQGRGNNGVGLMGRYEVQILDSWKNKTYFDGMCAAIYKQKPPLVNASRKPGEWQTYDIAFEAPRFGREGKLIRPGYVTVFHNGILVQNHVELQGTTSWDKVPKYTPHEPKLPLVLMYHGDPVRFRNIWIREIKELEGKRP